MVICIFLEFRVMDEEAHWLDLHGRASPTNNDPTINNSYSTMPEVNVLQGTYMTHNQSYMYFLHQK